MTRSLALKVTKLADSFSVSLTECNERKRPILIGETLLSHHSFRSVPHTFGDMTFAFRETVCIFSATLRFESETFGFRGKLMSSSTDNLLLSYNGKLVKWKQGVFDSRC